MATSLCDHTLLCNFPKCRAKLCSFAWVTSCSHAFCERHATSKLSHSPAVCPACSSALSGKMDVVRVELSPSEEYKAMALTGLRPEIILDIGSRAMAFWGYQVHQERMYQEYSLSRAEGQVKQLEKMLSHQNQSRELDLCATRGEISSLKKVMEEYKRKYGEAAERLMERNRQYQKLQGLYDSLRLRTMVVGGREEEPARPPTQPQCIPVGAFRPAASPGLVPSFLEGGGSVFTGGVAPDRPASFFQMMSPVQSRVCPFPQDH